MKNPLQTTLADAVRYLQQNGVPYALVGGLAVSLHGQPRVTADVDMVIAVDVNRALTLADEMELGGSQVSVVTAEDLLVMKVLASRPRDEQDVLGIVAQQGKLDWEYCLATASQLGDAIGQDLAGRIRALRDEHEINP